jgi:dihydrofolate reductase
MQNDLIDEYRVMLYPVALGAGKRIFGDGAGKTTLRLVDVKANGAGVVMLTYRQAESAPGVI